MNNLENKNIIVTGASGGIGNAIIKKLNEAGANILASGTRIAVSYTHLTLPTN